MISLKVWLSGGVSGGVIEIETDMIVNRRCVFDCLFYFLFSFFKRKGLTFCSRSDDCAVLLARLERSEAHDRFTARVSSFNIPVYKGVLVSALHNISIVKAKYKRESTTRQQTMPSSLVNCGNVVVFDVRQHLREHQ